MLGNKVMVVNNKLFWMEKKHKIYLASQSLKKALLFKEYK